MNVERIRKITDYLRTVQSCNFYFGNYIRINESLVSTKTSEELLEDLIAHKCGTAACAIGNLPLIFPEDWEYYPIPLFAGIGFRLKGSSYFKAVDAFTYLDIKYSMYTFLFFPSEYPSCNNTTTQDVISRVEWAIEHQDCIRYMKDHQIDPNQKLIPYQDQESEHSNA